MAVDMDLREIFGIWAHCPRSSFWKEVGPVHPNAPEAHVYINPLEGLMITAREHLASKGKALEVWVRSAQNVSDQEWYAATERVMPWVWNTLKAFFISLTLLGGLGADKEKLLKFVRTSYKKQDSTFIETGRGHQDPGLDELLAATRAFLVDLEGGIIERKTILKDELPEFVEAYGVEEC